MQLLLAQPHLHNRTHIKIQAFDISSLDDQFLLMWELIETKSMIMMMNWIGLTLNLTISLHFLTICCIIIKFTHHTNMLKMMNFQKSPSQQPKPSLPSLTCNIFETQHIWSRWSIATYLCPTPGRLLHQMIFMTLLNKKFQKSSYRPTKTKNLSPKHHVEIYRKFIHDWI